MGVDAELAAPLDLGQLETERPLAPREKEHDGVLDLLGDHLLQRGLVDQLQLHEDVAEQLVARAGALDLEGLLEVVGTQQPAGGEQLAEGLALTRGDGLDDLALADDDLALLPLALEHQDAGLAAQRNDLQDVGERQILQVADQAHERFNPQARAFRPPRGSSRIVVL